MIVNNDEYYTFTIIKAWLTLYGCVFVNVYSESFGLLRKTENVKYSYNEGCVLMFLGCFWMPGVCGFPLNATLSFRVEKRHAVTFILNNIQDTRYFYESEERSHCDHER